MTAEKEKLTAQAIFDERFAVPRDPRSQAYKTGMLALLKYRMGEIERADFYCPFELGSAEADAWFAGGDEGKHWYRMYTGDCQHK